MSTRDPGVTSGDCVRRSTRYLLGTYPWFSRRNGVWFASPGQHNSEVRPTIVRVCVLSFLGIVVSSVEVWVSDDTERV